MHRCRRWGASSPPKVLICGKSGKILEISSDKFKTFRRFFGLYGTSSWSVWGTKFFEQFWRNSAKIPSHPPNFLSHTPNAGITVAISNITFNLIKTCTQISNGSCHSVELLTLFLAVNAQFPSSMGSINRLLQAQFISVEKLLIFELKWIIYTTNITFYLIKTSPLMSKTVVLNRGWESCMQHPLCGSSAVFQQNL